MVGSQAAANNGTTNGTKSVLNTVSLTSGKTIVRMLARSRPKWLCCTGTIQGSQCCQRGHIVCVCLRDMYGEVRRSLKTSNCFFCLEVKPVTPATLQDRRRCYDSARHYNPSDHLSSALHSFKESANPSE